jgi:hypothetical protein
METCDVCGKTFKDRSGLTGHMRFSHPEPTGKKVEALASEVSALRQAVETLVNRSSNTVATEGNMSAELEIYDLKKQLEAAKSTVTYPHIDEYISHCKGCDEHKAELDGYLRRVLMDYRGNLTVDELPDELQAEIVKNVRNNIANKINSQFAGLKLEVDEDTLKRMNAVLHTVVGIVRGES